MAVLAVLLWVIVSFLCGACPFSLWIGKAALGVDIRQYGDGNPGASNVWRAGGARWGVTAILLDSFKGAIPVAIANFGFGWDSWILVPVALAPILGHAFSPFLRFQGGKALAVTLGIWVGLTVWVIPVLLGLLFTLWVVLLKPEGWAVLVSSLCLLVSFSFLPLDPSWFAVAAGMTLIFIWVQRDDLRKRPSLRLIKH